MPRGPEKGTNSWAERQRDTEYYLKAYQYQEKGRKSDKLRMINMISTKHARKNARRLLSDSNVGKKVGIAKIAKALDPLLMSEGIRQGFWLKLMHKVMISTYLEQVLTYLHHIKEIWNTICGDEKPRLEDVEALEKKCPRYSEAHSVEIREMLRGKTLFPDYSDEWKAQLLERLNSINILIPSLTTFFEDFKLLEECSPCFSHIFEREPDCSISKVLCKNFVRSEADFKAESLWLWLYVVQNHLEMPSTPKRDKNKLLAKHRSSFIDENILRSFAVRASERGFQSNKITAILNCSPESTHARVEDMMDQACHFAEDTDYQESRPAITGPTTQKPRHMSGFPDCESYHSDKKYLGNLENMYFNTAKGDQITTFFVMRSFFILFFHNSGESFPFTIQRPKTGTASLWNDGRDSSEYSTIMGTDDARDQNSDEELQTESQDHNGENYDFNENDRLRSQIDESDQEYRGNGADGDLQLQADEIEDRNITSLAEPVIFRTLLNEEWKTLVTIDGKDVTPQSVRKVARDVLKGTKGSYAALAYIIDGERLFTTIAQDCYDRVIVQEGIRKLIAVKKNFSSSLLISKAKSL